MGIFYSKPSINYNTPIGRDIINEVYFGESNELKKIQDQISLLRKKYTGESKYFTKINTDPDLLQLNRLIEDFFGFKTFSLVLDESASYNAYTFPVSSTLDAPIGDKIIETTKNGYRLKKEYGLSALTVIHTGLFFDEDFSDREIMAILLHEIGHSFGSGLSQGSTFVGLYDKTITLISLIYNTITLNLKGVSIAFNPTREWYNKTAEKIKRENPELNNMWHFLTGIKGFINSVITNVFVAMGVAGVIINPISSMLSTIYNKATNIIKDPTKIIRILFGYKQEVISDNFATVYGYGGDLATSLNKMQENGAGIATLKVTNNMPIIGHMYDLFSLPIDRLCSYLDEHPSTPSRCDNQLRYLKKELSKQSLDPKMKKQIMADIAMLEKEIDRMYKNVDISDNPRAFSRLYGGVLLKLCGGDVRSIMYKDMNDRFDQVADKSRI